MSTRHERLLIWQKAYNLTKDLMEITVRFPKPQQYDGLASEIRKTAFSLMETVMIANSTSGIATNQDLDRDIDYLKTIVRMARDLRYISIGQYEVISEKIVELGKMNGGWMKTKRAQPVLSDTTGRMMGTV